jgi:uncharacterized protein
MQTEMNTNIAKKQMCLKLANKPLVAEALKAEDKAEVLGFLGERPEHTFGMAGFIHNNGVVSPHNRGTFYGCRNQNGELEGVALIGHFILIEARSEASIAAFAQTAKTYANATMLLGEAETVQCFWNYYADGGQATRLYCRELLFTQQTPIEATAPVAGLRLARAEDLDLIVPAHAASAEAESGENPLATDAEGFRARCRRRIEQGATWVWIEDGVLKFKAEVITDTVDVIYLEGVWVDAGERGKGYGMRCLSQLSREFLKRSGSVCLLVNERFTGAQAFYKRAGFNLISTYDTIFLKSNCN